MSLKVLKQLITTFLGNLWVVVVAGGKGTRLFPISNLEKPKQFCRMNKENTFVQAVVQNFLKLGIINSHIVVVTTSESQTEHARSQLLSRGVLSQNIIQISPDLGYAGAMCEATRFISKLDPEAIIIHTPADQYIAADENFCDTIEAAVEEASNGSAVIVGVKVNDLVTAMGCGHALYEEAPSKCFDVKGFIEKPNEELANEIMRKGNSACNTGINVWKASTLLKAIDFDAIKGLGTDQLMEKFEKLKIAVGTFEWHDCGTLKSLYEISKKTPNHKNASLGGGEFERTDCRGSLLYADEGMLLQVTGARDDAVIFTIIDGKPIVVIAKLEESQRIKALAEDYSCHKDFLTDDFSFRARNNVILGSNMSNELAVGFVGVDHYAVHVCRKRDGSLEAIVSQQVR